MLIFDYRHVFGVEIAWGGGGVVFLETARTRRVLPGLRGLVSDFTFYQFGIMASS